MVHYNMAERNCPHFSMPSIEGKRHLPQPMGPNSVGYVDLMTEGDIDSGVFIRLFYPTNLQCLEEHKKWPSWYQSDYMMGYVSFVKSCSYNWPSWAPKHEFKYIEQLKYVFPLIPASVSSRIFEMFNGEINIPIIPEAPYFVQNEKRPVLVFSHGLGCSRLTYNRICYDAASYGFIVAAVEHRDGSACLSYDHNMNPIPYRSLSKSENEYQIRNSQVHKRAAEVSRALDLIFNLNDGNSGKIKILRGKRLYDDVQVLKSLTDSVDVSKCFVSGHSFGGATTLLSVSRDSRFRSGVLLDAWLFSLKDELIDVLSNVTRPILLIDSESFIVEENVKAKIEILKRDSSRNTGYCIRGSFHQNHMDTPLMMHDGKGFLKQVLGLQSPICPELFFSINNRLLLRFAASSLELERDNENESEILKTKSLLLCLREPSSNSDYYSSDCSCPFHHEE